ncbi:hypothetical protein [Flavobacterium urocaniciphilum]|uniref:Dolichyl-phosphate-mannose-protein mannosyltransferase n=1 Tax=Flavobacterium urocaniciphilum TaxID=1299341 RepID=A0A1H8YZY8_9FLAO|nr:hypothetical protein [Flavobacterium urocaniciphilum]SEP57673.1 hypothetical protein SAMN05444005_101391 [Flavobacterium urocaniciphilum]
MLFLIFIGLIFRVLFYFLNQNVILTNDSQSYIDLANLISSGSIEGYFGGRSPGYSLLLSFFGNSNQLVVCFQIIIGLVSSIFWFKILQFFKFNSVLSFAISLFFSAFIHVLSYENAILIESINLFLITLLIYYILKKHILEIVFCLTILVLLKPFYIFLPFIIFTYFVYNDPNWILVLKKKIIILILPLFAFISWSYVNYLNTGYFVSSTYFGLNKIQNCVNFIEKAPEEYNWIKIPYLKQRELHSENGLASPMCIWYAVDNGDFDYKKMTFPQLSNEFGKCADATIKNNFGLYIKQVLFLSFKEFWNVEIASSSLFESSSVLKYLWNFERIFLRIIKTLFLFLIPIYFYRFLKNRIFNFELLLVLIVFTTAILQAFVTYGSNGRYSFSFEFIMITIVIQFIRNNFLNFKNESTYIK